MARMIATGLLLASLILLIIYGVDAAIASSSGDKTGFLPLNEAVRGSFFGGGAVLMSIIGFVVARKEHSPIISVLLFVNGGLIIAGMAGLITQGALSSEESTNAIRTISTTVVLGAVLIALGVWKVLIDKKMIATKGRAQA